MADRVILHSDINSCYASVEMLHYPEYRHRPMAVGGDPEKRHGIVLAANYVAKAYGVKTAMPLWQARQVCPDIVFLPPRMELYVKYARMVRELYSDYTDRCESFGLDECWLDCTESVALKGTGIQIAESINARVKREIGLTVSIGVSWNKVFAKLGSDYKKPDGITAITRENYRQLVWPLPAGDLLFIGKSARERLRTMGIYTIGDIACTTPEVLTSHMGKFGEQLYRYANGLDDAPVMLEDETYEAKSIGNSTTTAQDLKTELEVQLILTQLAEQVSQRLRRKGVKCSVIELWIRDNELHSITRQIKLDRPTDITNELLDTAVKLFRTQYSWKRPVRSLGIRGSELTFEDAPVQMSLFSDVKHGILVQDGFEQEDVQRREKLAKMDQMIDQIRAKYGPQSIRRASIYQKQDEEA